MAKLPRLSLCTIGFAALLSSLGFSTASRAQCFTDLVACPSAPSAAPVQSAPTAAPAGNAPARGVMSQPSPPIGGPNPFVMQGVGIVGNAVGNAIGNAIGEALFGPPPGGPEDIQAQQAAAAQAAQAAAAAAQAAAAEKQRTDAIRGRLLGEMVNFDAAAPPPPPPGADSGLVVDGMPLMPTDTAPGQTVVNFGMPASVACKTAINCNPDGTAALSDDAVPVPNEHSIPQVPSNPTGTPAAAVRPRQKATAAASNELELSAADLARPVPMLRPKGSHDAPPPPPACRAIAQDLAATRQLERRAVLAADVYGSGKPDAARAALLAAARFDRISDDPASPEMKALFPGMEAKAIENLLAPAASNYRAAIYEDQTTKKIFAVFRGTEPTSLTDWRDGNADQAFGLSSPYYQRAIALARILKQSTALKGQGLELVGHSLGGGMADAAGVANQVKATSFNPSGVNPNTLPEGTNLSAAPRYDTDYVVNGEILDAHQSRPLATRASSSLDLVLGGPATVMAAAGNLADRATSDVMSGGNGDTKKGIQETAGAFSATMPPAIGKHVPLEPVFDDVNAPDPFRLHYMSTVAAAIHHRLQVGEAAYQTHQCGS